MVEQDAGSLPHSWRWSWAYRETGSDKWQKELGAKGETAFQGAGRKPVSLQSEVERLKAELKKVTEERNILKKVAAYFAKELG